MSDLNFLRELEPFQSLGRAGTKHLLNLAESRTAAPGTAIVRQGESGDAMYVVVEGTLEAQRRGSDGRLAFAAPLAPGDVFGEMALLTGEPRTADVVVTGDRPCRLLRLSKVEVDSLLKQHPPLANFLTRILDQRLSETNLPARVGKYLVLGEIGRGAMSTVYAAFHPDLNTGVALKMLSHRLVYEGKFPLRFLEEARLLASLRHDHIVQVYDAAQAFGTYYVVMERLEGSDLEIWLSQHGPLGFADVREVVRQVATALAYAHLKGVVHRDVKPGNVFRLASGGVKLMDFGIAVAPGPSALVDAGFYCSPAYAAPELILGNPIDARTDIYALGIMAFKLLTGKTPFPGQDHEEVFQAHLERPMPDLEATIPGIPPDLKAFIEGATQKDVNRRLRSCEDVLKGLEPEPGSLSPAELEGRVVTLLHPPAVRTEVDTLLRRLAESAAALPGVIARVGDLRPPGPP